MHRMPFVALLVGVVLLSAGPLAIASNVEQGRRQDTALEQDAAQVASAFTSYFDRARSLGLLLAQSPTFRPPAGEGVDNAAASRALAYMERLYPGAIGEACLIDDQGRELARVTEGTAASVTDLSSNESQNPFFEPTLALAQGEVYQASPYVSPDTKQWVISNSVLIRRPDGGSDIAHFEVSLASFQEYLTTGSSSQHVAVIDRSSGTVVLESGVALPPTSGVQFPAFPAGTAVRSADVAEPSTMTVQGQRLSMDAVVGGVGNANQWTVVEWSTLPASFYPQWVGVTATGAGAALVLLFLVLLRRRHTALRMAARLDHLTGLSNRRALEEALDVAVVAASQPGGDRVALLMLDLDGFKQVNDTFGHHKGDLVLQEIGRRLHANIFEYDTAARLGGDEFAVILRHLHRTADVATVAGRLREALVRPIDIDGVGQFVGVSIGAAVYADHGRSSGDLLRASDAAMYRAKRSRAGVLVYDVGTPSGAQESWLAAQLLVAIEKHEITLAYQPEYSLQSGRVVGVEALARWERSGEADIPPSQFVPLAEDTGMIRLLTHLTLRSALDEARAWRETGSHIAVSVNLSAHLVTDRNLPADVTAMLAERQLDGDALVLEVTEAAVTTDPEAAEEVLSGLRAIGVRILLDDFGSGYASIKALHGMALDGVKIDRDLVNDFSPAGQDLLAATMNMARLLGLSIVAKGIENQAGLDAVHRHGADVGQGYHLARPMSPDALRLLLNNGHAEMVVTAAERP